MELTNASGFVQSRWANTNAQSEGDEVESDDVQRKCRELFYADGAQMVVDCANLQTDIYSEMLRRYSALAQDINPIELDLTSLKDILSSRSQKEKMSVTITPEALEGLKAIRQDLLDKGDTVNSDLEAICSGNLTSYEFSGNDGQNFSIVVGNGINSIFGSQFKADAMRSYLTNWEEKGKVSLQTGLNAVDGYWSAIRGG